MKQKLKAVYPLLIIAVIVLALSMVISCKPVKPYGCTPKAAKKANQYFDKGLFACPEAMALRSATRWPVKEKVRDSIIYKQGRDVVTPGAVVYINCDSAVKAGTPTVKHQCPECVCPGKDTLEHYREVTQENTAALDACYAQNNTVTKDLIAASVKISALQATLKMKDARIKQLWTWLACAGIYFVLRIIIRAWFPMIGKFLP